MKSLKPKYSFKSKDLISISQLCARGAIPKSLRTVRQLCKDGKFPAVKEGRAWMTTRANVRAYFAQYGNTRFYEFVATTPPKLP